MLQLGRPGNRKEGGKEGRMKGERFRTNILLHLLWTPARPLARRAPALRAPVHGPAAAGRARGVGEGGKEGRDRIYGKKGQKAVRFRER